MKSETAKMGMRGRIAVLEIGHYNPLLNGQAVIVEEAGGEYKAPGGGSKSQDINECKEPPRRKRKNRFRQGE